MPSSKQLMRLCHSLGTMLRSGVQIDRALNVAANQGGSTRMRRAMTDAAQRIEQGSSLVDALAAQKMFPPLFLNLVDAGEQSGSLDRVLDELGRLFELQHRLWRRFLAKIALPVLEYIFAVLVLAGVSFFVSQFLGDAGSAAALGLPRARHMLLVGFGIPFGLAFSYLFVVKPLGGTRLWHEVLLRIPLLGRVAQALALARFSLVLHLMYEAGFPIEEALVRSFHATGNGAFAARGPAVAEAVLAGATLTEALEGTRLFPNEYLEIISVAEESGRVSERLEWLAGNYAETAEAAMGALVTGLTCLIWACVAAFIIYNIFKLFMARLTTILDLMG